MKKKVFFLTGDYWHHADTIRPLADVLFPTDLWELTFTERPEELLKSGYCPDLIVSFKDPIENDQIPTPAWCDDEWNSTAFDLIKNKGTGLLAVHAAVTDLEANHPVAENLIRATFVTHPEQCPVTFVPTAVHPVTEGVEEFTFPENDEHYIMEMLSGTQTQILGSTVSQNGVQPGLWVHECGSGRVCCATPGHTTANLLCKQYARLLGNAAEWCARLR